MRALSAALAAAFAAAFRTPDARWLGRARRAGSLTVRGLGLCACLVLLGAAYVVARSYWLPLPEVLVRPEPVGPRVLDRNGQLIGRLRGAGDVWSQPLGRRDLGPYTVPVLLAAEDARFWSHVGVDPLAMARAAGQALLHGRIVSGASTITQQLARTCFPRPRNLWGKLHEVSLALRIERSLGKEQILLAYLNRVHFGPQIVGMGAASDRYFGKPVAALDLGETALLLATVRGPSVYDLDRYLARAHARRDAILERALDQGRLTERDVGLALGTPAVKRPHLPWPGAWHWTRRIVREHAERSEIETTLDLRLERAVEQMTRQKQHGLARDGVGAVAVVVMDTASAEVLAYVGSQDPKSERQLGQNDGAASLRQPGSALKPLLYAAAVDRLGLVPGSVLPDEPLTFRTPTGHYTPDNYDRRFRGPVTLTRALSSSLNVPAVFVLERLGVERGLRALQSFGLTSLDREPEHYGLGLALGSGEVSLLELTAAYASLGRGGVFRPARLVNHANGGSPERVVSEHAADVVTRILEDERARAEMFGGAALAPGARFALKTGTSSGFRDAWAFVYDERRTVGVWVGNFDGSPMVRTTGALGAAPLAVEAWLEAVRSAGPARAPAPATTIALSPAPSLWTSAARITFPADGARLAPRAVGQNAEVVLRAAHAPGGARLLVDGRTVPWAQGTGTSQAVVAAAIGSHEVRLIDANGTELSSVTFHVMPG